MTKMKMDVDFRNGARKSMLQGDVHVCLCMCVCVHAYVHVCVCV